MWNTKQTDQGLKNAHIVNQNIQKETILKTLITISKKNNNMNNHIARPLVTKQNQSREHFYDQQIFKNAIC